MDTARAALIALIGAALLAASIAAFLGATRGENRAVPPAPDRPALYVRCSSQLGLDPTSATYRLCLGPLSGHSTSSTRPGARFHWAAITASIAS